MLKNLIAGAVLVQASLGVDCNSLNEDQKCQDPLKPCLHTNIGECAPENGPGCSGGSELIYCPADAVKDNIGRCGFKGCHEGSCVHNDPNIGACYPAKTDSTCHSGTTKCVIPSPSPLKKCGLGLAYDHNWDSKLYIYDLTDGARYEWSHIDFGYYNGAFSSALDRSTDILYTFLNHESPKRIIGYNIYTKQEILNKRFNRNVQFRGMDFNENDGHLYAAGYTYCGNQTCYGDIYELTTSGEFVERHRNVVPQVTTGFLFSKDYTHVYYTTHYDQLYKQEFGSSNLELLNFTASTSWFPDSIDWYTNDPNDPTMLICAADYSPTCWTYNVETGASIKLFDDAQGYYYLHGMEVLYDEFENCETALSTCPIKIDIKETLECSVIFKVLNIDCACTNDIEYIEILPSNISPVKLTQPSWESETGKFWAFDSCDTPFQGPFGIKIGKTGKELYEPNAFDLNDKMIYEIEANLCD